MVAGLLTALTLGILQLAFALLVRNTIQDAAAEGARYAALADSGLDVGAERTRDLISVALNSSYAGEVSASYGEFLGYPSVEVTVRTPLPLLGLIGLDRGMEVTGRAPAEGMRP